MQMRRGYASGPEHTTGALSLDCVQSQAAVLGSSWGISPLLTVLDAEQVLSEVTKLERSRE